MKSILKKIAPFISIAFFGFAVWFLAGELRHLNLHGITNYLTHISVLHVLVSLLFCVLSYWLLTGYDALGIDYIGEELAYSKTARAGFIGYAFSHNLGMALISGGSIRYRLYSAWGFTGLQVTQIVAFSAFTLWIGFCSTAGLSLLFVPPALPEGLYVPFVSLRVLGIILLAIVAGYILASAVLKKKVSFFRWSFTFPSLPMAIKQVVVASADWLLASAVLYVLLPDANVPFFGFLGIFLIAQIVGLFSQVPGGLGVFESIVLLYLSNFMDGSVAIGTLLVYRVIYYLIPLIGAMIVLGYQEYQANRKVVQEFGTRTAGWLHRIVSYAFSISIFIGGAILLFSGASPSEVPRMRWLQHIIPLPVIEMSHFFASIVGAAMLVLARGLQRRIDAAYHVTVGLLIFGILFSLLRGGDYEESIILAVMLLALIPSRKAFHRKASLFAQSFSPAWVTIILLVVVSSIWLGLFSYRNVEYQKDLWWQFSLLGDAPRYLRASVAVLGMTVIFGLIQIFKPRKIEEEESEESSFDAARRIVSHSKHAPSNLLFLRDKKLLFSDERHACIMYSIEDKSWVSMGDPLGPEDEVEELLWKFKDLSNEKEGWPVFYQVHDKFLDLYGDLGLSILKLGERAQIQLNNFEFEDERFSELRNEQHEFHKKDWQFAVIDPHEVAAFLPELKSVSDIWLQQKGNHEKGFSMGYFNESYLKNFPIAVVRHQGKIAAFSNLWSGAGRHEIAYDLIRYRPDTPPRLTDFLLTEIAQWAKAKHYKKFNLGIAPLSEMNEQKLEPQGAQFADQLYAYGEHLYNFRGLRHHKEKFHPAWVPIYLAAPSGLTLPTVLSNLSALISGHR